MEGFLKLMSPFFNLFLTKIFFFFSLWELLEHFMKNKNIILNKKQSHRLQWVPTYKTVGEQT